MALSPSLLGVVIEATPIAQPENVRLVKSDERREINVHGGRRPQGANIKLRKHDPPPVPSKHLTRCLRNRVQAKWASIAEKGEFTRAQHGVSGTAVEVSNIHEIVTGFCHEADDFRDRVVIDTTSTNAPDHCLDQKDVSLS